MSFDQETRKRGFDLYATEGMIRRLSPTITAVKTGIEGYWIVELKDGKWTCECINGVKDGACEHIYAAVLAKMAKRSFEKVMAPSEEAALKCRYCASPDIRRCGLRYTTRGISQRYYCNECERKFAVRIIASEQNTSNIPAEALWLLALVAQEVTKLNELLMQLDSKLTQLGKAPSSDRGVAPPTGEINANYLLAASIVLLTKHNPNNQSEGVKNEVSCQDLRTKS